jgi:hypothetical protein
MNAFEFFYLLVQRFAILYAQKLNLKYKTYERTNPRYQH